MSTKIRTSFIDGAWLKPSSRVTVRLNPGRTDRVAARWSPASRAQCRRAMEAANRAWPEWSATPAPQRCSLLEGFLDRLEKRASHLAPVITRENGKTRNESRAEISAALADARHLLRQARIDLKPGSTTVSGLSRELRHEPVGVYLLITPWNFPLATIARKMIPALAYGNTVVLKPSEYTPGPAVDLVRLFNRLPIPAGTVNLVLGTGRAVGSALIEHSALRGISFTGSNRVGLDLARQTAGRDVRLQLEMGGKNSLVVLADADLESAVEAARIGGFSCAGQWCTGTGRIIVEDTVYDRFCDALVEGTSQLKVGPGDLPGTEVGPVITGDRVRFARDAVIRAVDAGARLACGGKRPLLPRGPGHFFEPTVLTEVCPDMEVFQDELFVPILPIARAKDETDALHLANQGQMGLSASIFTSSPGKAARFTRGVEAGIVHHNLHTAYRTPDLPVSAWRNSGRGHPECGNDARDFFTRPRAVYRKA